MLSCVRISFCLVWLGTATEEDAAGADIVTRGLDQETEVRMACWEDSGCVRGGEIRGELGQRAMDGIGLAARTRTRLDLSPSDFRLARLARPAKS